MPRIEDRVADKSQMVFMRKSYNLGYLYGRREGRIEQRQSDINHLWKWAKGEGMTRLPTKEEIERDMRACAEAAFKARITPKQAANCVPSGKLKCPDCPFKKQAKGEE